MRGQAQPDTTAEREAEGGRTDCSLKNLVSVASSPGRSSAVTQTRVADGSGEAPSEMDTPFTGATSEPAEPLNPQPRRSCHESDARSAGSGCGAAAEGAGERGCAADAEADGVAGPRTGDDGPARDCWRRSHSASTSSAGGADSASSAPLAPGAEADMPQGQAAQTRNGEKARPNG